MDDSIRQLIFRAIDETMSPEELEQLQDLLEHDLEVREEYLHTIGLTESLSEMAMENSKSPNAPEDYRSSLIVNNRRGSNANDLDTQGPKKLVKDFSDGWLSNIGVTGYGQIVAAALLVIAVGASAFWLGLQKNKMQTPDEIVEVASSNAELQIAGHATLRRSVDLTWSDGQPGFRDGDVLPGGLLEFDQGVAEIDFFCGATLIVEGPASLDLESDWSVKIDKGRLRARVPPAARGFVVKAAGTEVVDLGTEFAMEINSDSARVEVIDGEVAIRGGIHDGKHLVDGESASLSGNQKETSLVAGLTTSKDLAQRRETANQELLVKWKQEMEPYHTDQRMIAYFPIAGGLDRRVVANHAITGSHLDGLAVGPVDVREGRFGARSVGIGFDRLGSRVRTRIDGQFEAFTFACWIRIDRLDHRYNALFMGDGFENGEPHWQIRNDGRMMISVMVDDAQKIQHFSDLERRVVTDAGLHRNYYSKPFWNPAKSGQWFHLAAIYDPEKRQVRQYANGELICEETILDKFLITKLRIGAAEIGNWGQPFRQTPEFAVRNINGVIDELMIFDDALTSEEILEIYERGKPLGY